MRLYRVPINPMVPPTLNNSTLNTVCRSCRNLYEKRAGNIYEMMVPVAHPVKLRTLPKLEAVNARINGTNQMAMVRIA